MIKKLYDFFIRIKEHIFEFNLYEHIMSILNFGTLYFFLLYPLKGGLSWIYRMLTGKHQEVVKNIEEKREFKRKLRLVIKFVCILMYPALYKDKEKKKGKGKN